MENTDWNKLFDLIPEIEHTTYFGKTVFPEKSQDGVMNAPYVNENQLVSRFRNIVAELGITPDFDWMAWEEGKDLLNYEDTNYSELDTETLCKLLTVIIRADRFAEGYLVSKFRDGTVLNIVNGLKNIIKQ